MEYLRYGIEWLLGAIRLALLDANRLIGRLKFDTIEMQVKGFDLLQAGRCLHKFGITVEARMARNLKVILLLAHIGVVRDAEIEALVRIDPIVNDGQLLQALVAQLVPVVRLKRTEADALGQCRIAGFTAGAAPTRRIAQRPIQTILRV